MLTFTLPSELRELVQGNQKWMYALLFQISAQVTQQLARDPRHIGGQIGLVGVLHTWTRNLIYHPHVHYLAPGGGLSADGQTWLPAQNRFFLPAPALSKLFRAAFRSALQKTSLYSQVPSKVWHKNWVVNCKPVGDGQAALKYLAPYIHRVAISNRRLVKFTDNGSLETSQVTFQYRVADTSQIKFCTLSVESFMQRFLQHILPHGFVKVRYYGFFGASVRPRLVLLQKQLNQTTAPDQADETVQETVAAETHPKILCPKCGQPMLFQRDIQPSTCRAP
jgi:hypothetical protein